ncbi:uncharacterized protein Tco025E_04924 [Trypanosoma conorhini]|uniref:Uncharacterized protein n=1 Tax=Trypanosoma conorhini TaxID=83891 RepID=A0A422PHI4_9TRYP|nr:uncharacterized protein Tco025E_04924 [Trypanosoma conorhini]RNF17185.1 hypothetical protein Tco025E_04924 [Trypanosoma conorhini]
MSGAFPTGVPNLFTSPFAAFPARSLFHSTERPAEGGCAFTHEDRLMLQLLYQQQQALQIQLQSMALSMQQLHLTLAGLCKLPAAMEAYGTTVNSTSPASNLPNFVATEAQSSFNNTADAAMAPQRQTAKDPQGGDAAIDTQASRGKEVSCSCTPPREELDFSRHSAMNQSTESAAPWDPSASSRQSSVIRMARGENPLLSSMRGKLPTPNHSVAGSVSAGTGYSASANVSGSLEDPRSSFRPAIYQTSSLSLHADPEAKNVAAAGQTVPGAHHHQQQQRVVLDNRKTDPAGRSHSSAEAVSLMNRRYEELRHARPRNAACDKQCRGEKEEHGDTSLSAAGYDSQSDGYGSYETRQYLKNVGII